jgi:hypothetical protein
MRAASASSWCVEPQDIRPALGAGEASRTALVGDLRRSSKLGRGRAKAADEELLRDAELARDPSKCGTCQARGAHSSSTCRVSRSPAIALDLLQSTIVASPRKRPNHPDRAGSRRLASLAARGCRPPVTRRPGFTWSDVSLRRGEQVALREEKLVDLSWRCVRWYRSGDRLQELVADLDKALNIRRPHGQDSSPIPIRLNVTQDDDNF